MSPRRPDETAALLRQALQQSESTARARAPGWVPDLESIIVASAEQPRHRRQLGIGLAAAVVVAAVATAPFLLPTPSAAPPASSAPTLQERAMPGTVEPTVQDSLVSAPPGDHDPQASATDSPASPETRTAASCTDDRLVAIAGEPKGRDPVLLAALRGDVAEVRRLLAAGADPDTTDGDWTPLLAAATLGCLDMVTALLGAGADPNRTVLGPVSPGDTVGYQTVLDFAVTSREPRVLQALLEAGADPYIDPLAISSPFSVSARLGEDEMVQLFLDAGHDPNVMVGGTSVFGDAVEQPTTLAVLLDDAAARGVTPEPTSLLRATAAAANGEPEAEQSIRLLLDSGLDPATAYAVEPYTILDEQTELSAQQLALQLNADDSILELLGVEDSTRDSGTPLIRS